MSAGVCGCVCAYSEYIYYIISTYVHACRCRRVERIGVFANSSFLVPLASLPFDFRALRVSRFPREPPGLTGVNVHW